MAIGFHGFDNANDVPEYGKSDVVTEMTGERPEPDSFPPAATEADADSAKQQERE